VPLQQGATEEEGDQVEQEGHQVEQEAVNHHPYLVGITPSSRNCTPHTVGGNMASKRLALYSFRLTVS
jgi:hypothetical protein